jgi:hypothetical protein
MVRLAAAFVPLLAFGTGLLAQVPDPAPRPQPELLPGANLDPAIPSPQQVLGYAPGAELTDSAGVRQYLRAVAAASPRVAVVDYGRSWEGRALQYAIVGSAANLARLPDIEAGLQRLADPRGLDAAQEAALRASLPAVAWLAHTVHGDEPSGVDSALHLIHHLAASPDDARAHPTLRAILAHCLVIVDPLQNPDGLDRFVAGTRAARGRWPDATPLGAEHSQPWPGGRVNAALFDMNRDWFAMTQPETQARIAAFLRWWPQVYVDLHEMGGNATYYFAPPAEPVHGEIGAGQRAWLARYGRNNARWFDRHGFAYFTREAFDSFYPGYGESWPTFHGSIGMTFEMASSRGLVYRRKDDTLLHYAQCIQHHFVAALGTLETLANGRDEALLTFVEQRRAAVARGQQGPVREYVFPARGDRTRLARFANLLTAQGIEVHVASAELRSERARPLGGGEAAAQTFPAGSLVVSLAQPASTLAHVLIEPHFDMEQGFLAEQRRREAKRLDTEFYDLTAWSLPLLFGIEAWQGEAATSGARQVLAPGGASSGAPVLRETPPQVGYLIAWGQNGAAALLGDLLRDGASVRCIDREFVHEGRTFPAGSLLLRVDRQPPDLHRRLGELAAVHGVEVVCADSSWVERGPDFGTRHGHTLVRPRVAMLWDRPVQANSAGWVRYLLEHRYGVPVSPLRTHDLARVELERFTVLILPEGGYGEALRGAGKAAIERFVQQGGVLVTFGAATRWLTEPDVGLLASAAEVRPAQPAAAPGTAEAPAKPPAGEAAGQPAAPAAPPAPKPFDYAAAVRPDKEPPPAVPGAIVRVQVDAEHWLGFGYRGEANVVHDSANIFTPVKLDRGTNVAIYAPAERLVLAGFVWDEARQQLPHKAYLVHQPLGRGHLVAFAEDPNVRAFADGLHLLLLNAVLLTAGR